MREVPEKMEEEKKAEDTVFWIIPIQMRMFILVIHPTGIEKGSQLL